MDDHLKARAIAHRYALRQRTDPRWRRQQRNAGRLLLAQWIALVLGTYALIYGVESWSLRIALLVPWSIYSSIAIDTIVHHLNHWPLSRRRFVNIVVRCLGVFTLVQALEVRHYHRDHHRFNNRFEDELTTLESAERHQSFYRFVVAELPSFLWNSLPWVPLAPKIKHLRTSRPALYAEIVIGRWAGFAWVASLLYVAPLPTLLLVVPLTLIVAPIVTFTMSLTDHVPGDPTRVFQQATYYEPVTRIERIVCALNNQSAATHLTHHLFPHIHWAHLRSLQQELAPILKAHDAPRSIVVNTSLIGNPFELLSTIRRLGRAREIVAGSEIDWNGAAGSRPRRSTKQLS